MSIIAVVLPVFSIAVLGYVLTWVGVFRVDDVGGLTRYVFNVALPVMLFDSISTVDLPDTVRWSFLVAYYIPALIVFGVGFLLAERAFGLPRTAGGIYGMGCSYSNTVLIGLPIISTAWGDDAVLPLMMIISIHTAVLFTLTTAVAETGRTTTGSAVAHEGGAGAGRLLKRTALGMLTNPIFGGLVIGLVFNVAGLRFTGPTDTVIQWIRASALPAALFVTGASLRRYRVMGHILPAGTMVVLKLVVHPALVWVLAVPVFHLPPLWAATAILTAALPTGVNASVFASKYDAAVAPVVTATLVSTMLSIVGLTVLLTAFGAVG